MTLLAYLVLASAQWCYCFSFSLKFEFLSFGFNFCVDRSSEVLCWKIEHFLEFVSKMFTF